MGSKGDPTQPLSCLALVVDSGSTRSMLSRSPVTAERYYLSKRLQSCSGSHRTRYRRQPGLYMLWLDAKSGRDCLAGLTLYRNNNEKRAIKSAISGTSVTSALRTNRYGILRCLGVLDTCEAFSFSFSFSEEHTAEDVDNGFFRGISYASTLTRDQLRQ
jgi:hypothetical protein